MGSLKRVKAVTGITLYGDNKDVMVEFITDPIVATEICYALWKPQLEEAEITEEDMDEIVGAEELELMRDEVIDQMPGFSEYWTIIAMLRTEIRAGNFDQLIKIAATVDEKSEESGPSPSPSNNASEGA